MRVQADRIVVQRRTGAADTLRHRIGDNLTGRLSNDPSGPLSLPAMTSDSANRSDRPDDAPALGAKGSLLDATFYQAWALDADGAWHYLPVHATPDSAAGTFDSWRDRIKAGALRCPYPGCEVTFTGVRQGAGRIAFVHPKTATTHTDKQAKETWWRLAAAQAVIRWAGEAYPGATATTGATDLAADPDVLVTVPGGGRIAVELRYSTFGADEWAERHKAYEDAGVTDVWLFAHVGPFARKASAGSDRLRPPQPMAGLVSGETTVGWLNPFLGLVGVPQEPDAGTVAVRQLDLADWRVPGAERPAGGSPDTPATASAEIPAGGEPETPAGGEAAETAPDEAIAAAETGAAGTDEPETAAAPEPAAEAATEPAGTTDETSAEPAATTDETSAEPATDEPEPVATAPEHAGVGEGGEPVVGSTDDERIDEGTPDAGPTAGTPTTPAGPARRTGWLRRMLDKLRRPAA